MSTAAPRNTDTPAAKTSRSGWRGGEVARPQGRCSVCGRTIEPEEKYFAALRELADGFERLDVCQQSWENFDRKDVLGFWQTAMPRPQEKKKIFVDDEVLCNLFERLEETAEPVKVNFRFVLGLILLRKRLLAFEASRKDTGREVWVVRFRGREARFDLVDPKLTETQVAEVSTQLGEILNEEL